MAENIKRIENQVTGISGEFFVAAELAKRNFQVSLTLGNAKAVDLFATKIDSGKTFKIEVKTLRKSPNCFTLNPARISVDAFYIFVYLNEIGDNPSYFVVKGKTILQNLLSYYGSSIKKERKTINHGPLQRHKDKWGMIN